MNENTKPNEADVVKFTTAEKVKILIDRNPDVNLTSLSRMLGYGRQNISKNLKNGSLKTSDLDEILDIMGYEVTFTKKNNA